MTSYRPHATGLSIRFHWLLTLSFALLLSLPGVVFFDGLALADEDDDSDSDSLFVCVEGAPCGEGDFVIPRRN